MRKRFFLYLNVVTPICLCAVLLMAQSSGITTKDQKAKEAVDAAIKAIGGADKIDSIKSLIIKGTYTNIPDDGYVLPLGIPLKPTPPEQFEIRILLPDSYIYIYDTGVVINAKQYRGVSRGTLIPPISIMRSDAIVSDKSKQPSSLMDKYNESFINHSTNAEINKWSRILIGMLMKTGAEPLALSSGTKPGSFSLTPGALGEIEFDSKTGYPSIIRYKIVGPFTAAQDSLPPGVKVAPAGNYSSNSVSIVGVLESERSDDGVMRFEDRFSVNGIMFPKVIAIRDGLGITQERRIEEVLINPSLTLKDFDVSQLNNAINIQGKPAGNAD